MGKIKIFIKTKKHPDYRILLRNTNNRIKDNKHLSFYSDLSHKDFFNEIKRCFKKIQSEIAAENIYFPDSCGDKCTHFVIVYNKDGKSYTFGIRAENCECSELCEKLVEMSKIEKVKL